MREGVKGKYIRVREGVKGKREGGKHGEPCSSLWLLLPWTAIAFPASL